MLLDEGDVLSMTRDEIFHRIADVLVELFEVDRTAITLGARWTEDLDLDSIDAVDLVVRLQEMTGRRASEEALQKVRTIGDIVQLVADLDATQGLRSM
jgi:acyl carrier protein